MAKKSNRQFAEALYELSKDASPEKLDVLLEGFVKILVKYHRLRQADSIIEEYIKIDKIKSGIKTIEVISARELDNKTLEKIKKAFGNKVEESTSLDESMIGGIKIKMDDKILDSSIKTQLNNLKQAMTR